MVIGQVDAERESTVVARRLDAALVLHRADNSRGDLGLHRHRVLGEQHGGLGRRAGQRPRRRRAPSMSAVWRNRGPAGGPGPR
jgi:hypothetical protein